MRNVREKLIDLIGSVEYGNGSLIGNNFQKGFIEKIADYLIANGVTVQDGKPLEAFLHPIDAYKGLKAKYLVFKADTGKEVDNCFILRPGKDAAAVEALRVYANATDNETLAEDLYNWVGKGEPVQEWISVKDRLPALHIDDYEEPDGSRMQFDVSDDQWVITTSGVQTKARYETGPVFQGWVGEHGETVRNVTHWMPMPQPPKGD